MSTFKTWKRMDRWDLVLPPSRPSLPQLNYFLTRLNQIDRNKPIAVLGSTPEYRDMLTFARFDNVYIFESNEEFYEKTANYRSRASSETLILGDWLKTLPNFPATFAAILSDLTSGNVPYDYHSQFYGSIANALTPEGIFCDKILTHNMALITLEGVYNKYKLAPLNLLTANHLNCEGLFCSEVLEVSEKLDTTFAYQQLEQLSQEEGWLALINLTKLITPPGGLWHYGRSWQALQEVYTRHLLILEESEDFPGSPYYGRVKLFIGKGH